MTAASTRVETIRQHAIALEGILRVLQRNHLYDEETIHGIDQLFDAGLSSLSEIACELTQLEEAEGLAHVPAPDDDEREGRRRRKGPRGRVGGDR